MSVKTRDGKSVLEDLHQSGSMRVLFPRPASPPTAMLLNTAGGITGGDSFDISAHVGTGATLTVTTQAAERAYGAQPGPAGVLDTKLSADEGAFLSWLPQETILFEASAFRRRLSVDLADTAQALIVEPLVFGRAAHGEVLHNIVFNDQIRIRRGGRVIYADGIALNGDVAAQMASPATGNGAGALATVIFASPQAEAALEPLRAIIAQNLGTQAGVSCLAPDLLALRVLAPDSFEMRQLLLPVLDHLTQNRLPICWRL